MSDIEQGVPSGDVEPPLTVPPMVLPETGRGMVPIRSGQGVVLGYSARGEEAGRFYLAPRGVGGTRRATWFAADEAGWEAAWRAFEEAEPGNAGEYRRQLARAAELRAQRTSTAVPAPLGQVASQRLGDLLAVGGILTAIGVITFWLCLFARSSELADDGDAGGLEILVVLGALVGLTGIAIALVGIVGWGVKLGRDASGS